MENETTEIMTNEDIVTDVADVEDEFVENDSGTGLKIAAGVGIAAIVGVLAYRKLIKPRIAKFKKPKVVDAEATVEDIDDDLFEDEEDEDDSIVEEAKKN